MKTKTINVADLLTYSDRAVISKIVSERVFAEYSDFHEFKWQISVSVPINYEEESND